MNQNGKPKQAVLYARFSPRPNAAECESCERQLEDLRAWCFNNNYQIVSEHRDEALSGGDDFTDRPGMFDAAAACKRGMTFLVRSFDRMFRDARKALMFCAMMESKGVNVVSATEPAANGTDPIAEMIRTIMLAVAEYQRAMIRARTKVRMLQYQAGGRRMSKQAPWGWRVDPANPARIIEDDAEMAVARDIVRMKGEGASLRDIAAWLEQQGVDRRGKKTWDHVLVNRIYQRHKGAA